MSEHRFEGDTELGRKIIAAVREVAAEQPDFIYQRVVLDDMRECPVCVYVEQREDGTFHESCLIGRSLWRCGLIDASFFDVDLNVESIGLLVTSDWWTSRHPALSDREIRWLGFAQSAQDIRDSWSVAVAHADEIDRRTLAA